VEITFDTDGKFPKNGFIGLRFIFGKHFFVNLITVSFRTNGPDSGNPDCSCAWLGNKSWPNYLKYKKIEQAEIVGKNIAILLYLFLIY